MKKKSPESLKAFFKKPFLRYPLLFWTGATSSWRIYLEKPLTVEEIRTNREQRIFDALTKMGVKSIDLVIRIIPVRVEEYRRIKR